MINVTRLDHTLLIVNSDLIEFIENTPDTVITLSSNQKLTVLESSEELLSRIQVWRRSLLPSAGPARVTRPQADDAGI